MSENKEKKEGGTNEEFKVETKRIALKDLLLKFKSEASRLELEIKVFKNTIGIKIDWNEKDKYTKNTDVLPGEIKSIVERMSILSSDIERLTRNYQVNVYRGMSNHGP